ncbi:hypothetical protein Q1695_000525 [Nippostrongylus brasiliensis]|nr:hypothetical protein Q1695_000525 [Nippostrongylus brasiliensis]
MSLAIVFFPHSSSADVVPASAVHGDVRRGAVTKAKWGDRTYIAKVLYVSPKELCELKIKHVTADERLIVV